MVLLLENHFDEIRSKVISYGRKNNHSSPEDLFSETIYSVLKNSDSFEGSLSNLLSYILNVAHSKLVDYYRSPYTSRTHLIDNLCHHPYLVHYDDYFANQYFTDLQKYLTRNEYFSITAKYIYDFEDSLICSFINKTPSNLRVIRNRAYKKIKKGYK
jgi:RNA polymerase sigma factor (sigma-70 family)